ncbi:MAG: flagellin [Lachnospira sp.]
MRINTNISAMTVNNSLQKAQNNLSASIERLSSGYKINSSADDPAGCAISEKMRMQIRGLKQADNNAADGESVLNTAEGALQEINAMLVRMKELTVQAANDVNSDQERSAIQDELNSINKEIDRITSETEFNTQPLLNGNLSRRVYSNVQNVVNLSVTDNYPAGIYGVTVTQDARQAIAVGDGNIAMTSTDTIAKDEVGSISINGYDINIAEGDDLNTVVSKLMAGADMTGGKMFVTASLTNDTSDKTLVGTIQSDGSTVTTPTGGNGLEYAGYVPATTYIGNKIIFMTNEYGSDMSLDITCSNQKLAQKLGLENAYVRPDSADKGIQAQGSDVQAKFTEDSGERVGFSNSAVISTSGTVITINDVNNREFQFDVPGNVAGTQFDDTGLNPAATNTSEKEIEQEVTDVGRMSIHIGANQDQVIVIDIPAVTSYTLGTDTINVMTSVTSQQAIAKVDVAIGRVNDVRSKIGAYSNRFEHTRNNLGVSTENAESALSTMMDTDMAEEMTNYTSMTVLTQAATSILSQANERPSTVLQILQ